MATITLSVPWPLRAGSEPVAAGLLAEYFGVGDSGVPAYSGASFQTIGGPDPDPSRFTPLDLVAVGLLSVTVPAPATIAILEPDADALARRLAGVPAGLSLVDAADEVLDEEQSALAGLWWTLRRYPGVGRTVASKLLARKRASLVPVWDALVAREFGLTDSFGYWRAMREEVRRDDRALWRRAEELVDECGLAERVSPLRAIDVVTWMHSRDHARSRRLAVGAQVRMPSQRSAVD